MFRAVDHTAEKALIVLFENYRNGSGEKPGIAKIVYRWNGNEFVEDDAIQRQLSGTRNAKEIDRRLAKIKAQGK